MQPATSLLWVNMPQSQSNNYYMQQQQNLQHPYVDWSETNLFDANTQRVLIEGHRLGAVLHVLLVPSAQRQQLQHHTTTMSQDSHNYYTLTGTMHESIMPFSWEKRCANFNCLPHIPCPKLKERSTLQYYCITKQRPWVHRSRMCI